MNFLAHCLLAEEAGKGKLPGLVVGGFLGDFIKGRIPAEFPNYLALGVKLHRRIDAFSNQLDGITKSCRRFPPNLRRVAPPVVDIISDYCLAKTWDTYSNESLGSFSKRTYQELIRYTCYFPPQGKRFLSYTLDNDLLGNYGKIENINIGIASISRRLEQPDLQKDLLNEVPQLLGLIEIDFSQFFPEILAHSINWINKQNSNT